MKELIKEATDYARNYPLDFALEVITAFYIVWGGIFLISAVG